MFDAIFGRSVKILKILAKVQCVLAFVQERFREKTVLCITHEREEAEALGAKIIAL